MEGMFQYSKETRREYLDQIIEGKRNLRICSFGSEFHNVLMWAHYADGFKGICIEVELTEWPGYEIAPVDYDDYDLVFENHHGEYAHFWATMILKKKNKAWKYENEIRVLTNNEFVTQPVVEIRSVLFGARTPAASREAISRVVRPGVPLWETRIDKKSNRVAKVRQIAAADP